MKNFMLVFIFSFIFLAGCSASATRYSGKIYPPTTKVEVFQVVPPGIKYDEIGEVTACIFYSDNVKQMVEKAKELGADAIITRGVKFVFFSCLRKRGIAIKYK